MKVKTGNIFLSTGEKITQSCLGEKIKKESHKICQVLEKKKRNKDNANKQLFVQAKQIFVGFCREMENLTIRQIYFHGLYADSDKMKNNQNYES